MARTALSDRERCKRYFQIATTEEAASMFELARVILETREILKAPEPKRRARKQKAGDQQPVLIAK